MVSVFHNNGKGTDNLLERCFTSVTGDYMAVCEADDYWAYSYKLDKQSSFLVERQDCSMCFNSSLVSFEDNHENDYSSHRSLIKDTYKTSELIIENFIRNFSSCFYRADIIKNLPDKLYEFGVNEWIFNIAYSEYGNIGFLNEEMNVCQIHDERIDPYDIDIEENIKLRSLVDLYNKFFSYKYDKEFIKCKEHLEYQIRQKIQKILNDKKLKKTITGKDKYLFLVNDSSFEIKQHFDDNYKNIFDAEDFIRYHDKIKKFSEERNIKYYFFIIPDKSLVCRDLLPFKVYDIKRNYDSIKDLIPDFGKYLDNTCYFRTDSHINYLGGRELTYHYLNHIDKNFRRVDMDELFAEQLRVESLSREGDLTSE